MKSDKEMMMKDGVTMDSMMKKEGDVVKATGRILEVPVSNSIIGRVVNALGAAIADHRIAGLARPGERFFAYFSRKT